MLDFDDPASLSKRSLLASVSRLLKLPVSRLEQCANGAVYCQLIDAHFSGVVPLHKVNFVAKENHEIFSNYKALQTAFELLEITKDIEVTKLSKGHTASNLELLQWLFKFPLRRRVILDGYDPKQKRLTCKGGRTDDVPLPSCLTASLDMSPGSPASCGSGKGRAWSSRDIVGGKIDVSRVVSRYKEGLLKPVVISKSPPKNEAHSFSSPQISGQSDQGTDMDFGRKESFTYGSTQTDDLSSDEETESAFRQGGTSNLSTVEERLARVTAMEWGGEAEVSGEQRLTIPVTEDKVGVGQDDERDMESSVFSGFIALHPEDILQQDYANSEDSQLCDSDVHTKQQSSGTIPLGQSGGKMLDDASDRIILEDVSYPQVETQQSRSEMNDGQEDSRHSPATLLVASSHADCFSALLLSKEHEEALSSEEHEEGLKEGGITLTPFKSAAEVSPAATVSNSQQNPQWGDLPLDSASLMYSPPNRGLRAHETEVIGGALAAAQAALEEVEQVLPKLELHLQTLHTKSKDLMTRGKQRSLMGATRTALEHTSLLLEDVSYQCVAIQVGPTAAPNDAVEHSAALHHLHNKLLAQLNDMWPLLFESLSSRPDPVLVARAPNGDRDIASEDFSTLQLDSVVKGVGQAQFSLMQAMHKRAAALTSTFFQDSENAPEHAGPSGRPPTSSNKTSRCFKLGPLQLKKLRNGDVYRGRYHSGKKNGDGVYNFLNNDVYEGEFSSDRMDGHGVYTFTHEGRYEGGWQSAVYSGYGTESFSKGSTYYGQYNAGLRNGYGACRFFNGDFYEGTWSNGLRDGQGMQQCTDNSNYVGEYVKGKRQGYGVYSFPNGDKYLGQYSEDLPHGHGIYIFSSGQKYEGEWANGKKHGWSIYTVDHGQEFVGQWQDSKPQWIQALRKLNVIEDDAADEIPNDVQHLAVTAKNNAMEAAQAALVRAEHHWTRASPILVASAIQNAVFAAIQAQSTRRRAMDIAMKLSMAVSSSYIG